MAETINVLQAGGGDWRDEYRIPEELAWNYIEGSCSDLPEELTGKVFDAVIIDGVISSELIAFLRKKCRTYTMFYTGQCPSDAETAGLLRLKMAKKLTGIQKFVNIMPYVLHRDQFGHRVYVRTLEIDDSVRRPVQYVGNRAVRVTVDHPDTFRQIALVRRCIMLNYNGRKVVEIWPEYVVEGDAELRLKLRFYDGVSSELLWTKTVEGEELSAPIRVASEETGYLSVQFLARGRGTVEIGQLHHRSSRVGLGQLVPGGRRHADGKRGELISYFDPGDRKPPLMVYFAGYNQAEVFEGIGMMSRFGTPYLLLSDNRLEGGAFYIGEKEYEENAASVIRDALETLHFDRSQLILTGLSMGTYGAVYYGSMIPPRAIVIGKPVMNLGTVAENERRNRMKGFPTSLDVLYMMTGGVDEEHVRLLNERVWERFDCADFRETLFSIAYMQQDDYDPDAYRDILRHLEDKGILVAAKGFEGRHNDNTGGIIQWFKGQIRRILIQEFQREVE